MRFLVYLAALLSLVWAPSATAAHGATLQHPADTDAAKPQFIYVARRKWHIDIGFDIGDLIPSLTTVSSQVPGARFIFFGFGDARYLKTRPRNLPVLLGALWPGRGLVLATSVLTEPALAFGSDQVLALPVPARQAHEAQAFVWRSLNSDPAVTPGPYAGSFYLSAKPRYSALYTCNTWAAQVLAAAMLPVRSSGVIFAGQLWKQVRRLDGRPSTPTAAVSRADLSRSRRQP